MTLLRVFLLLTLGTLAHAATPTAALPKDSPSIAFFYAAAPPWDELRAFDIVVIEPDHVPDPTRLKLPRTRVAAYVSLGEIHPSREYAKRIPKAWQRGTNTAWGGHLVDQTSPGWPEFFVNEVITPLWNRGYRSFFVDTLDSYHLFSKTDAERAAQETGMVAALAELGRRYPQARLIFNRGFEILPRTYKQVDAVVAESIFQTYDASTKRYGTVKAQDREWLLGQFEKIRTDYKLPVIAIDYVAPGQRELARKTAKRLIDIGIIPWVTTHDLNSLGVGLIEVMPRRVLFIHSPLRNEYALIEAGSVRFGSLPLSYLGYIPEFVDPAHLPATDLAGRYAGVVVWLDTAPSSQDRKSLLSWLPQQNASNIPIVFVNEVEFLLNTPLGQTLGLSSLSADRTAEPIQIEQRDAMMGYETAPRPSVEGFYPLAVAGSKPLLTLKRGAMRQVAAAIAPWGGYVIDPYTVQTLPGGEINNWVIDPFAFFKQALQLPDMPVPDVTTETGRRMFMVHMDGDGFVSRSELPGNALAGAVVRDRIVNTYRIPMTLSVIEAEVSPNGLYPKLSQEAEKIAREIFKAPHVAIGTHSYSHPFSWENVATDSKSRLPVQNYTFSAEREVEGSVNYINTRLAPANKKVEIFFWTGDAIPSSDTVALTARAGLLNINGGGTIATTTYPSVSRMDGLGLPRGENFQVFAPNQNENIYTNNWLGPFYGFERVIETFELTEKPRRLKPINIYFHTYIVTKRAGMISFDKVMNYALKQEITPVYVADYARKVLDFQRLVIARSESGWRVRGAGDLHTLRVPTSLGVPDLPRSTAVAGYKKESEQQYVHLVGDSSELVLQTSENKMPRLESANARVSTYTAQGANYSWTLEGEVPLEFTLANAESCRLRAGGQALTPARRTSGLSHYRMTAHVARPLEAICQ